MNGFIQSNEIAERWGLSPRQVQRLCIDGRIKGAIKFGNTWAIPEDAPKPTRTAKNGKPGRKTKTNTEVT